jgi:hypothetical protein
MELPVLLDVQRLLFALPLVAQYAAFVDITMRTNKVSLAALLYH